MSQEQVGGFVFESKSDLCGICSDREEEGDLRMKNRIMEMRVRVIEVVLRNKKTMPLKQFFFIFFFLPQVFFFCFWVCSKT